MSLKELRMEPDSPTTGTAPSFSGLRALPARQKICAAVAFSLAVSLLSQPLPAVGACGLAGLLLTCSGLSPAFIAKRLLPINAFFLTLWLLLPLSGISSPDPEAAFSLGPLHLSASGAALALLITLKGNAIAAALLALAGSSSVPENGHALLRLGLSEKFVVLLLTTHSNLERLTAEYQRGFQAAKLRGFTPATSLASYGVYARLIGLLLVRSWQRSQRIETAMRLRGFCGRFPLIAPKRPTREKSGLVLLSLCCTAAIGLSAWNWYA